MKFRRSRCVHFLVLTVVAITIFISVLRYTRNPRLTALTENLDFFNLHHLFQPSTSDNFDAQAVGLFKKALAESTDIQDNAVARYIVYHENPGRDAVEIPPYLAGEGENPHISPFDVRLTLGVLLHKLSSDLSSGTPREKLQIDTFHWSDWSNTSLYDQMLLSPEKSAQNCDFLAHKRVVKGSLQKDVVKDVRECCFDDIDQELERVQNDKQRLAYVQRIKNSPLKMGFHVFRNPERTSQKARILAASSYLVDFMPPPMAVHILLEANNSLHSLHVPVNDDISGRVRVIDSPAAQNLAQQQKSVSVPDELNKLTDLLAPFPKRQPAYEKHLQHEDFVDDSGYILQQLVNKPDLTKQELMYFKSLHQSMTTNDPTKYFDEAKLVKSERNWAMGSHMDWRFYKGNRYNSDMQLPLLHALYSAWLRFTRANDINTWIAHGSLLGWFWNGLSFPWDSDIDVQVPISELHKLSRKFNQTVIVDFGPDSSNVKLGRYFLDCGTWVSHRNRGNGLNNIDARFIDLDSGLYIDITALALSEMPTPLRYNSILPEELKVPAKSGDYVPEKERERNIAGQLYNCRNLHFSSLRELSPLRATGMEGALAYVPNDFQEILQVEYGSSSIESHRFRTSILLPKLRLWVSAKIFKDIAKIRGEQTAVSPNLPPLQKTMPQVGMPKVQPDPDGPSKREVDSKDEAKLTKDDAQVAKDALAKRSPPQFTIETFTDEEYLEFLSIDRLVLEEYLVTKDFTALHERQMQLLLQNQSTKQLLFPHGKLPAEFKPFRQDISHYLALRDDIDYKKQLEHYDRLYQEFKKGKQES